MVPSFSWGVPRLMMMIMYCMIDIMYYIINYQLFIHAKRSGFQGMLPALIVWTQENLILNFKNGENSAFCFNLNFGKQGRSRRTNRTRDQGSDAGGLTTIRIRYTG
jgi:hypothetical protein